MFSILSTALLRDTPTATQPCCESTSLITALLCESCWSEPSHCWMGGSTLLSLIIAQIKTIKMEKISMGIASLSQLSSMAECELTFTFPFGCHAWFNLFYYEELPSSPVLVHPTWVTFPRLLTNPSICLSGCLCLNLSQLFSHCCWQLLSDLHFLFISITNWSESHYCCDAHTC